jgi:hypothetical protein
MNGSFRWATGAWDTKALKVKGLGSGSRVTICTRVAFEQKQKGAVLAGCAFDRHREVRQSQSVDAEDGAATDAEDGAAS